MANRECYIVRDLKGAHIKGFTNYTKAVEMAIKKGYLVYYDQSYGKEKLVYPRELGK